MDMREKGWGETGSWNEMVFKPNMIGEKHYIAKKMRLKVQPSNYTTISIASETLINWLEHP